MFIEREKRNKLMTRRFRTQTDSNWGGSEVNKFGMGIILGYKYLSGNDSLEQSYENNSAEIGIRINW